MALARSRPGAGLAGGAAAKLVAEIVGRVLQFGVVYVAQRTLGPATYGEFTYALAGGIVLAPAADLGLQLIVGREIARDRTRLASAAGAGLACKVALAIAVVPALAAISLTRAPGVRIATFLVGVGLVLTSFVEFFGHVFRGLQRVEFDALLNLLARFLTAVAGVAFLWSGYGLMGLAAAWAAGPAIGALAGFAWLHLRAPVERRQLDRAAWRPLVAEALPLGGAIILSAAFTRAPVFLLDAFSGASAVGLYGVAQKLTEPLAIVPAAVMAAVFPAFTRASFAGGRPRDAAALGKRAVELLALLGATVGVTGVLLAPWIIALLYGSQYAGSERPLQILAIGCALTFVNYALTHLLIATGRQRLNLRFTAIVFGVALVLGLVLIPPLGVVGAALTAVLGEAVLLLLCLRAL